MTKEEFTKLSNITNYIYWRDDKDGTLRFSRSWSQKEYMNIPVGMMENMIVKIEKLSRSGFTLSYRDNVVGERIDSDYLNKLTGIKFPAYSVVDYYNNGMRIIAKLQFENLVDISTVKDFCESDSLEIKNNYIYNDKRVSLSIFRNMKFAKLIIRDNILVCGNAIKKDSEYDY